MVIRWVSLRKLARAAKKQCNFKRTEAWIKLKTLRLGAFPRSCLVNTKACLKCASAGGVLVFFISV